MLTLADGLIPSSQAADSSKKSLLKPKQCPNCDEPNKLESKFCSKCKFVLSFDAFNEGLEEKAKAAKETEEIKKQLGDLQLQQQIMKAETEIDRANHEILAGMH